MLPRHRGERHLPTVLSSNQMAMMLNRTMNVNHRLLLILLYTSGVRSGELLSLKLTDRLLDRHQLKITLGKGAKDRIVNIPEATVKSIKIYLKKYEPKTYLVEGIYVGRSYSESSLKKVIDQAVSRAEIETKVSVHTFRYTYATHQKESGTDLVTLQQQLGHSRISTTMIYIQLCQTQPRIINHPIKNLNIRRP
jgi:integrase/recombinase XerD